MNRILRPIRVGPTMFRQRVLYRSFRIGYLSFFAKRNDAFFIIIKFYLFILPCFG